MSLLPRLSSLWRNLFHKFRMEQDLTEEIDAYLEMLIEQKINEGLDPAEARRGALIELGGEQVVELLRTLFLFALADSRRFVAICGEGRLLECE
ncbi:MAG TPA: permease prefix domain 1-containing protein [Blastocatellia bacterium]|nr:permease prefix domain 1-containing protein [Blastocatellia bacterium]